MPIGQDGISGFFIYVRNIQYINGGIHLTGLKYGSFLLQIVYKLLLHFGYTSKL
jgi:hypothetical protein